MAHHLAETRSSCDYCGLPAPTYRSQEAGEATYCCVGCRIASALTSSSGDAGQVPVGPDPPGAGHLLHHERDGLRDGPMGLSGDQRSGGQRLARPVSLRRLAVRRAGVVVAGRTLAGRRLGLAASPTMEHRRSVGRRCRRVLRLFDDLALAGRAACSTSKSAAWCSWR